MAQDLTKNIRQCAIELLGSSFSFRPGQLEAIKAVVECVQKNIKQTVLEAPTGSGKSLIGIIAAYVLHKLYGKKSYILTSDLSLFDQYVEDLKKLNARVNCFGYVKGKDNYICWENGCSVSQATCSLKGASIVGIAKGMDWSYESLCKERCEYLKDYVRAIESPITLMTYQLYFIQRNYVEDVIFKGKNVNFPKRDLVICDECHKLCDICQTHFAPRVNIKKPEWMELLDAYSQRTNGNCYDSGDMARQRIVENLKMCDTKDQILEYTSRYEQYLSHYVELNESIREKCKSKLSLSKNDKALLAAGNLARQEHCKFEDMIHFVDEHNASEYLVNSVSDDDITINFIFDSVMLAKYFHSKSNCELLMSATIGDFNEYAKITGLDDETYQGFVMKSTFDFSNSPIYFSSTNKMSYEEKNESIKGIVKQVIGICESNANSRGIIQTGSYYNTEVLKKLLPKSILDRCLFYNGARQKAKALDSFIRYGKHKDDNHVLVGPTLIEGLNFPDDLCRFQICIKVPYAYLGNKYVRSKKDMIDGWYIYDVLNKLCQGIGRGIRHEKDWCKTYILDGCIKPLIPYLESTSVLAGRFVEYTSQKS